MWLAFSRSYHIFSLCQLTTLTIRNFLSQDPSFTYLSHHRLPSSTDFTTRPFLLSISVFVFSFFITFFVWFHAADEAGYSPRFGRTLIQCIVKKQSLVLIISQIHWELVGVRLECVPLEVSHTIQRLLRDPAHLPYITVWTLWNHFACLNHSLKLNIHDAVEACAVHKCISHFKNFYWKTVLTLWCITTQRNESLCFIIIIIIIIILLLRIRHDRRHTWT